MLSPAYLIGAARGHRRRYHRWLRKAQRTDVQYVPPRGVTVDKESGSPTYHLSSAQSTVFESSARFRVLIAGRRFGKTHDACVELITAALERPNSLCWYVAPTYSMAKDIAWEALKSLLPPWLIKRKPNESRLTITLINGSRIQLKGAEHPNRLRGRSLWRVVLDEFPLMREIVWTEAVRPSLADLGGGALFIGTPYGFNWGYDLFLMGQGVLPQRSPADIVYDANGVDTRVAELKDWTSWQFTTEQGGRVTPAELMAARALLDPRIYRQEFQASFEALAGRVYNTFDRAVHVDASLVDPAGDVLVGMDFNVNPMTAVIAVRHKTKTGIVELHVLDAIERPNSNTPEMAEELLRRFPRQVPDPARPGKTKAGRRVLICPDPSGNARKTSAAVGQTDFTILEQAGFYIDAPAAAPLVKDRVNNTNAALKSADGTIRLRIHPRAAPVIRALEGLTWKDGTSAPDPRSPHIHITDALGYLLWQQLNLLEAAWGTSRFAL